MIQDEYGEYVNSEETYERIGAFIKQGFSVIIGWTDGAGTHLDILFNAMVIPVPSEIPNVLQGGLRGRELFVAIMRIGAFGFDTDGPHSVGYYAEKLHLGHPDNPTARGVADLINGVIIQMNKANV